MDDFFGLFLFLVFLVSMMVLFIIALSGTDKITQKYAVDCARQQGIVLEDQCYKETSLVKITIPRES